MRKSLPIPEPDQLRAISSGLVDVYRLLTEYLGDLNKAPDFRQYITITRAQLAEYLRQHPDLAEQHVFQPTDPRYHEYPVLERVDGGYRVYQMDHGNPWAIREFEELAVAAAEYLMWQFC